MKSVVCDVNVVFKLLITEPDSEQAFRVIENSQVVVPELLFLEVGNALWSRIHAGRSDFDQVRGWFQDLEKFEFDVRPIRPYVGQALQIADTLDRPIYDCLYLALAETLSIPFVTADARLLSAIRRAPRPSNEVIALADFA